MISKALPQEKKTIYGIWKYCFHADADSACDHAEWPNRTDFDDSGSSDAAFLPQARLHA